MDNQLEAIQQQLNQMQGNASAWSALQPTGVESMVQGVAVPISLETPMGKIRCYLQLPAELGQDPMKLQQVLQQMAQQGYPLDAWTPKKKEWDKSDDWSGGGYGGGRSYQQRRRW